MCEKNNSNLRYRVANYCTNEEPLLHQAYRETLNRLLWRFSMEHDGDKIDWSNVSNKYCIYYVHDNNEWTIESNQYCRNIGAVYFYSLQIAQQAIEEIVKPFMKECPDFKF